MFSVVIPLYNKELSIKNTIQSVLNQTFQDFEIVIVNDGSTDNSLQVVQQINDSRIRIINKPNGGVSSARNRGIKESKYKWIAFLDGDDLWLENHLIEYKKALEKEPNINWLISGYTSVAKNKSRDIIHMNRGILENVFEDLQKGLSIHTSAVCIKRNLFQEYPDLFFREGLNNSEDREVWYKLCCIDKNPYYIDKSLSLYDVAVEGSLTKQIVATDKEHFLSMMDRIDNFEPYKKLNPSIQEDFKSYIFKINSYFLGNRYVVGSFKKNHKPYLTNIQYFIYKYTSFLPYLFRWMINKIYNLFVRILA